MRTKLEIAAGILILLLAALSFRSWLEEHDARLNLKAQLDAQDAVIQKAEKSIEDRDSALTQKIADYEKLRAQKLTPQQVIKEIPKLTVEPLPQPITELPNAPSAQVPNEDLSVIRDSLIQCKEISAKLSACQEDANDTILKVDALTKQRDDALRVVHGGGFWQRLKRNSKWFMWGAAIGAGALAAAHH